MSLGRKKANFATRHPTSMEWLIHTTHVFIMVLGIFRCWRYELADFIEVECPTPIAKFAKRKMLNSGSKSIKFE